MKLLLYLLRRLFWMIPTVLVVLLVVFIVTRILPGNPVVLIAGQNPTEEKIARLTQEMGLDKPILVQFKIYVTDILHGDLGIAWHTGNSVNTDILSRFPATAELALVALFLSLLIGIPIGVLASIHRDKALDHFLGVASLVGFSIPKFWLGLLLMYFFCFQLELFPSPVGRLSIDVTHPNHVTGLYIVDSLLTGNIKALISSVQHIILPAFTLALGQIAGFSRMVRSRMIEVLDSEYIQAARANGISDKRIYYIYALKNTLIPLITYVADSVLWLLSGVVVVEIIFSWPGVGLYAIDSLFVQDYAGVQGVALIIAACSVLIYITMDLLYFAVDPRVKY